MPKAENEEDTYRGIENDDLESGQRYGLMEDERAMSGCKRICFAYGFLQSRFEKHCLLPIISCLFLLVYIIGFYSGVQSNCICNTTLT